MTVRITQLTTNNITDKFRGILKQAGPNHFRFHDVRHYSASIQHALEIPDAYIMEHSGRSGNKRHININISSYVE